MDTAQLEKKYESLSDDQKPAFKKAVVLNILNANYGGKIQNLLMDSSASKGAIVSGTFETPRMGGKPLLMRYTIDKDSCVLSPQNPDVLDHSEGEEGLIYGLLLSFKEGYIPLEYYNFAQQQLNCVKGWSCRGENGYTCLSKTKKNCNNALAGEHKDYASWLQEAINTNPNLHQDHIAEANKLGITKQVAPTPIPPLPTTPTGRIAPPPKKSKPTAAAKKSAATAQNALAAKKSAVTAQNALAAKQNALAAKKSAVQNAAARAKKSTSVPTTTTSPAPIASAPTTTPAPTSIDQAPKLIVNQKGLDDARKDLISRFGQKKVEDAEKNVQKIFNDPNTQVYCKVGSSDTIGHILNGGFKTSAELGIHDHSIPYLADDDYQDARNRVENTVLGYGLKTKPSDRPIYGYLGGKDLNGASHSGTESYGKITVKFKPAIKDRSTFTGADSFKSGIASDVVNTGNPPPPNAASLVHSMRHGYDKTKLPIHYPSHYANKSDDVNQLNGATKAKSIDELPGHLATTGNKYCEAQIHGKPQPSEIEEIHFEQIGKDSRGNDNGLTQSVLDAAHKHGIKVFVKGKEIKPGTLLNGKTSNKVEEINQALNNGDFHNLLDITKDVIDAANKMPTNPGNQHDKIMAYLAEQNGFADKPKLVDEQTVTDAWKDGGHLLIRGLTSSTYTKAFKQDPYYVGGAGGTMFGNGQYSWHCGKAKLGQEVPPPPIGYDPNTAQKDAKDAWKVGTKTGYIVQSGATLRMAYDKTANITTQTSMGKEIEELKGKIEKWANQERAKLLNNALNNTANSPTIADFNQKVNDMKNMLFGDQKRGYNTNNPGASGRFAVIKGYDGCMLDDTYEPNRMFAIYNRGKILCQKDDLDYSQGKKQGAA